MKTRIIVAAIGALPLLVVLCLLPPVGTAVLFILLTGLGAFELFRAGGLLERRGALLLCMASAAAVQLTVLLCGYPEAVWVLLPFGVLLFLLWVAYYERELSFGLKGLAISLLAGFVVPIGLAAMTALRRETSGQLWVLAPLMVSFLGDAGAYFVGICFGKRKMAPRTSPKKTIAGLFGGLASSGLFLGLFSLLLRLAGWEVKVWYAVLAGVCGGAVAQLGDLSFSLIKRECGVKDYGKLLPGHGGAYDRFDSTCFSAPMIWAVLRLLGVF